MPKNAESDVQNDDATNLKGTGTFFVIFKFINGLNIMQIPKVAPKESKNPGENNAKG